MGLRTRLEALEARAESERPPNPEVREHMRKILCEVADARRNGRPIPREAREIGEAIGKRRRELGA
jgi:hypothetical protein